MRRRATAILLVSQLAGAACGAQVSGDYEGVPFAPTGTSFAVLDRHDFLPAGDSVIAVRRSESGRKMHLFFSGAALDTGEAWTQWPSARLLDLKKSVALKDGVLLTNIPLARALDRDAMNVELDQDGTTGSGDFDVAVVVGDPGDAMGDRGFGDLVTVRATFDVVDAPARGGFVTGQIEVKRARAPGQGGELATGDVTLDFRVPVTAERLGEANLAVVRPVMACAAKAGPTRAASCKDAPPDAFFDETGLVMGR